MGGEWHYKGEKKQNHAWKNIPGFGNILNYIIQNHSMLFYAYEHHALIIPMET